MSLNKECLLQVYDFYDMTAEQYRDWASQPQDNTTRIFLRDLESDMKHLDQTLKKAGEQ